MLHELATINLSDLDGTKLETSSSEGHPSNGKKRPATDEEGTEVTSKDHWAEEPQEKIGRRAKKFRVEWMNEVYFKDWLRPHPTDETYCICIACDIRLRCGKSELEKHASGLKHCRRMETLKDRLQRGSRLSILTEGSSAQTADRILCEQNGTFYVAGGSESFDDQQDTDDSAAMGTTAAESALSKALLKFSMYLDTNSDMARRKMEIVEAEHLRRMQVLNKELELRSLEVLIRQTELQKLNNIQSSSKGLIIEEHVLDDDDDEKY